MKINELNKNLDHNINEELSHEIISAMIGAGTSITIGAMVAYVINQVLGNSGDTGKVRKKINQFLGIQGAKKITKIMKNKSTKEIKQFVKDMKNDSVRTKQFAKILEDHYNGKKTKEQVIKAFERMPYVTQKKFGKGDK